MIPIIFFPGWPDESVSAYTQRLANQTPDNAGRWKSIYATTHVSEAKYAICQDNHLSLRLARQAGFTSSQIIYIKREADSSLPELDASTVLLTYQGSQKLIPAVWWLSIPFNELSSLPYPNKNRSCSAIVSSCQTLPGHRRRLHFINALASVADIDVFGRGHSLHSFSHRYLGELTDTGRCKRKGLLDYSHSICIENTQENGYVTEKFNDALLCFTVPVYHGAPNIHHYYPEKSYYVLPDITTQVAIDSCLHLIDESPSLDTMLSLREARELLLYKYNIWNIVNSLVVHAES